jgi:adenylylsulfate kinase
VNASKNILWSESYITIEDREKMFGHKGAVLWLTGLSGSGKSTIAKELEKVLINKKIHSYVLDGDNIRHGLNSDLGFSETDRQENIRRVGAVSALFSDAGVIVIAAFISPFREGRQLAKEACGNEQFFEIFLDVPLTVCEERDPKGLYKKVRAGEIEKFTGIDSPYEQPLQPALSINTADTSIEESVKMLFDLLVENKIISENS